MKTFALDSLFSGTDPVETLVIGYFPAAAFAAAGLPVERYDATDFRRQQDGI
jgi:hypothetical protein